MKRTRETINYTHPNERWNISGATFFDGEDQNEEQRRFANQKLQKEWLVQQMEEKKRAQEIQRQQDMLYDQKRLHFKDLEDSARDQYFAQNRAVATGGSQNNCQLNAHKKDMERSKKNHEQADDQSKLTYVNNSTLRETSEFKAGLTAKSFGAC